MKLVGKKAGKEAHGEELPMWEVLYDFAPPELQTVTPSAKDKEEALLVACDYYGCSSHNVARMLANFPEWSPDPEGERYGLFLVKKVKA